MAETGRKRSYQEIAKIRQWYREKERREAEERAERLRRTLENELDVDWANAVEREGS